MKKDRNILIERLTGSPVFEHMVEIVERKGVGHPDSICDAVMEEISIALSREYLSRFGKVLHHNIDKGLLIAGEVEHKFGGGLITGPMRLVIGDRATFESEGERIPVEKIAVETAKKWMRDNLRFIDPDSDFEYNVELKPGSPELTDIFARESRVLGSNDTSAAVGYAPLTPAEKMVIAIEHYLNSSGFKERFPASGEDVKVMGYRAGRDLYLIIAMPLIDRFIDSPEAYFNLKQEILDDLVEFANDKKQESLGNIYIDLNALDDPDRGINGIYLSVTGTSAEDADSGEVGRGNRVNGVIALNRPMGAEAAAGKNPVSHVGKIYTILTHRIANEVYNSVEGIQEAYIWLCSEIGQPIDEPKIASAQLILEPGISIDKVTPKVREVIDLELANITSFTTELAEGKYRVW
ncbi:MAG TPA: methionine adenosyltransferase [Anaerolineae bacterium]|nr:methionine adenosyltransferase [Anaerolineae bacterium]